MDKIFLLEWLDCLTCVFDYLIICCRYDVPYNYVVTSVIAESTVLNLRGKQNMLNFHYVNECNSLPTLMIQWLSWHLDLVIFVHNYYLGTVGAAIG